MRHCIAMMLAIILCVTGFAMIGGTAYAAQTDDGTAEKVRLYGEIYDMGYEFDRLDPLTNNFTIVVTDSEGTTSTSTTNTGSYSIELDAGETYTVAYSAYIAGRMANMKFTLKFTGNEDKEMNIVVRTKNVAGWNAELNKYSCPMNSVVFRNLSQPFFLNDTISFAKEKYKVNVADTKPVTVELDSTSGIVYNNSMCTFESSDESIVTINEKGELTAVSKGAAIVKAIMEVEGEETLLTATTTVEVCKGFDYTRDGYCFPNERDTFYNCFNDEGTKLIESDPDYAIPYERYQEVFGKTITKNFWNFAIKGKRDWERCFGISVSSILFYDGKLDPMDYGVSHYQEGDTINEGLYDGAIRLDKDGDKVFEEVTAKVLRTGTKEDGGVSELTKMIERYHIMQNAANWMEEREVTIDDIIANWDTGVAYSISLVSNEGNGHAVVLETCGDVPAKNNEGYYELNIYDPEFPAFTDERVGYKDEITSYAQTTLLYKPASEDSEAYFKINCGSPSEKQGMTGKDIHFYNVGDAPVEFDGSMTLLDSTRLWVAYHLPEDASLWEFCIAYKGVELVNDSWIQRKYNEELMKEIEDWYVDYISSGEGGITVRLYMDADIDDLDIEFSEGINFSYGYGNTIGGVSADSDVALSFEGGVMNIATAEDGNVQFLAESHNENGTIFSTLAEGELVAGNVLSVSLKNDKYTVVSDEVVELELTFNNEDSNVEEKATVTVGPEEVDIADKYTISYNLNGGTNASGNPTSYSVETATITLQNPTRSGYTFGGWYSDSGFKTKVTQIAKGSSGDVTLYAKWTPNKYSIIFNGNGATSGSMSSLAGRTYDISYTLTDNAFTRTGYSFKGWNTKADGSGTSYADKANVKNLTATQNGTVTLYAQWKMQDKVAPPTIKKSGNKVVISATTEGSTIYYTTDGSTPTTTNGIKVNKSSVNLNTFSGHVKAIAVKDGYANSDMAKLTLFAADKERNVSFAVKGVFGGRNVTFNSDLKGAKIYYSSTTSTLSTSDKCVNVGETILFEDFYGTIYARTYKDGQWGNVCRLILKIPVVKTPTISIDSKGYATIKTATPNSYLYYTTDGSTPSMTNGKRVSSPYVRVYVGKGKTVKAIAVRSCFTNSGVATKR